MRTRRSRRTDRGRSAGSADGSTEDGALARRRRVLVAVVVGAVILSGVGIAASTVIKSPAQVAAEAGAPERDVLTAQVESRVLKESVILRGKVVADRTVTISPSASVAEGAASIVTKLSAKAGDKVEAGRVLVEISGRPVFALRGDLPVYRDLKPGAKGDDVTQLQQALAGLGFGGGGDPKGEFGASTQAALASYYESIGYDPRPVSDEGPRWWGPRRRASPPPTGRCRTYGPTARRTRRPSPVPRRTWRTRNGHWTRRGFRPARCCPPPRSSYSTAFPHVWNPYACASGTLPRAVS